MGRKTAISAAVVCCGLLGLAVALRPTTARSENHALYAHAAPVAPGQVVCIGDSITRRWSNAPCINRGISGETSAMIRERFARDVLALKPSVIVFLAGDNDIGRAGYPENTESDIQQMADAARRAGAAVLLCLLPPMYPARKWYDVAGINTAPFRARRRDAKIRALNAWLRGYAAANRLRCVDYYSSMRDGDLFLVDGTHPNAAGYAIMRATLEKQLRP